MNITFLYPPTNQQVTGGGSVHFQQIAKHLALAGNNLGILSDKPEAPEFKHFSPTPVSLYKAQRWTDCYYSRLRPTGTVPFRIPRTLQYMRKINPKPIVWEINAPVHEGVILGKFDVAECQRREQLLREAAKNVAGAICVSKEISEYAEQILGIKNVRYIPNGGDISLFDEPTASAENPLAGIPGPIYFWMGSGELPWEGDRLMIDLALRLQETGKPGTVVLAGTPRPDIHETPDNLIRLGRIAHAELPGILKSSDVCFALYDIEAFSRHGYQFYNSPLKLYEYMCAGKPIIATNAGEINRTLEHNSDGMLVDNELDEIINVLERIEHEDGLSNKLAARSREKVQSLYSWEHAAQKTMDLVHSLIK